MKIIKKAGEQLPSWATAEIRRVLTFTGAGRALIDGSQFLISRGWTWLGDRLGWWERLGAVAFGGYALAFAIIHAPRAAPFAAPVIVVCWCAASWWASPITSEPKQAAETAAEQEPTTTPEEVYAATLDWIRQQIGDRQGVHLRDLLEHAQAHGMFEDLDVTTLRAHLERRGFPVKDSVRVRGLGVTVGIRRDDLPLLPEPLPDPDCSEPPDSELHPV